MHAAFAHFFHFVVHVDHAVVAWVFAHTYTAVSRVTSLPFWAFWVTRAFTTLWRVFFG